MKLKILSLVGSLSVIFIAAVIWRMNHFIQEDRTNWAQAQMRTQVISLQQTAQALLHDLQHKTPLLQDSIRDKNFWFAVDPFKAMAWVRDLNNPTLENTAIKDGTGLDDTNLVSAVKNLQGHKVAQGSFLLVPWQDSQRRNWLMVVWPWAENRKLILWTGAEYFQALLETHKGALAKLSFVNESGQVLAHSQAEYFGSRLNDQYLYKEFKSSGALQGGGSFKDSSGEDFQGYYEAIPNTNLVLMASTSYHDLLADNNKVWASFLFVGLGLVLLTLGGISLLKISDAPVADGNTIRSLPAVKEVFLKIPEKESVAKASVTQENRQEVFKKIAGSLGHEMRSPLARILGLSQMILEKEKDQTLAAYAGSILRETRSARDVLEKLFSFAQEKESVMRPLRVEAVVKNLLQRWQPEFQKRNVQLIQKIESVPEVMADMNLIEKALESILQNSMDSMERILKREIRVTVRAISSGAEIVIQDIGEGIDAEHLSKIFDPFFTTRSFSQHLGLGLSAAYGVIKQHGGTLRVESQKDHGTTVTLTLPDQNHFKEAGSVPSLATAVHVTGDSDRFSPADVEIEQLLDFQETESSDLSISEKTFFITEASLEPSPRQEIKKETITFAPKAPTALDEYKVEIRRPRRPIIENS